LDADHPENGVLIPRRNTGEDIIARIDEEAEEFKVHLKSPEARNDFNGFLARKR
jgi:hypothetical protein